MNEHAAGCPPERRPEAPWPVLLAITGASGAIYAQSLARVLDKIGQPFHLVISETGREVFSHELGGEALRKLEGRAERIYHPEEIGAAPASGSSRWHAMVICPCTMGTLGAIVSGAGRNLIHRAADCFLKERRPVIAAVRETPLNRIHLANMLAFNDAGGTIFPAMPAMYNKPDTIGEMAEFFASRIAEFIGLHIKDMARWQGMPDED